MKNKKSGARTLLWSVIMSAPGPLVVGLGLIAGRSSTQIADFVRRSAELLAIIMSFMIYQITTKNGKCDEVKRKKMGAMLQSLRGYDDVPRRCDHGSSCMGSHRSR